MPFDDLTATSLRKAVYGYTRAEVDAFMARLTAGKGMTAEEVRSMRFTMALRGYDTAQVDAMLEQLAERLPAHTFDRAAARRGPGLDVRGRIFAMALRGYSLEEVDLFLDRLADELDRRRGVGFGSSLGLTADDVEHVEFTKALRGYSMIEVDRFLDEAVAELRALGG